MEKLKDYAANVWYLIRVKPKEAGGLVLLGFVALPVGRFLVGLL